MLFFLGFNLKFKFLVKTGLLVDFVFKKLNSFVYKRIFFFSVFIFFEKFLIEHSFKSHFSLITKYASGDFSYILSLSLIHIIILL